MWLATITTFAQEQKVVMIVAGQPITQQTLFDAYKQNNINTASKKQKLLFARSYALYLLKIKEAKLLLKNSNQHNIKQPQTATINNVIYYSDSIKKEAKKIYNSMQHEASANGGFIKVADIFVRVNQKATNNEIKKAQQLIEQAYSELQQGHSFETIAEKYSDNKKEMTQWGEEPWMFKGQNVKEFENVAFNLQPNQYSKPFLSVDGYHILLLKNKTTTLPFSQIDQNLYSYIAKRNYRSEIEQLQTNTTTTTPTLPQQHGNTPTPQNTIDNDDITLLTALNNTILYNCDKDTNKIEQYFNSHKKNYIFAQNTFKGYVLYAKNKYLLKQLKKQVKQLSINNLDSTAIKQMHNNSYSVECGTFKQGDNSVVDKLFFKQKNTQTNNNYTALVGKKHKQNTSLKQVYDLVLADYKEYLEQQWENKLEKKYKIVVNKKYL